MVIQVVQDGSGCKMRGSLSGALKDTFMPGDLHEVKLCRGGEEQGKGALMFYSGVKTAASLLPSINEHNLWFKKSGEEQNL